MSNKKLIFIYLGFILVGVIFVFKFGMGPRPVDKIRLSEFENTHVIVNSLFLSLRQEMKNLPILIIGVDDKESLHTAVINEFINMNTEAGMKYDAIVMDESLQSMKDLQAERFSIIQEKDRFLSGVENALKNKLRLMIIVPNLYSASILPKSVTKDLKVKYKDPVFLSMTLSNFPRVRDEEQALSITCNTGDEDLAQTGVLGCLILQKARSYYRKKMKSQSLIGFLMQVGTTDFVFPLTTEK